MSLTALHEIISIGKEKADNYLSEYTTNKNEILYFNTKMSDATNSQKEAEYRQKRDDYLPTKRACIEWLVPPVDKSNPAYSNYILKYQEYARVYCAHFLAWIFNLAGYKNLYCGGKAERSVEGVKSYYQQRGQYFKKGTPSIQIGDLIMFHTGRSKSDSGVNHIGIVSKILDDNQVETIEGNTSFDDNGSQDTGNNICIRIRSLNNKVGKFWFNGFARIYSENIPPVGQPMPEFPLPSGWVFAKSGYRSHNDISDSWGSYIEYI